MALSSMSSVCIVVVSLLLVQCASGFRSVIGYGTALRKRAVPLRDIPLEIADKLDPTKSWDVKFIFNGEEKVVSMCEDTSVLEKGEEIFDGVDSSCRNGVCTTCAGRVIAGSENTVLAVSGLGEPQLKAGFVCACQCYVTGPGVTVQLGMYDQVYESQYGQFEKSYGELKYADTVTQSERAAPVKKKNIFGF